MRSDALSVRSVSERLPVPGIGTRQQWMSVGAAHRMFEDGRLTRVARGLYVPTGDGELAIERLAALMPEGAVIGGWAAGLAYGFRDAGPTMDSSTAQPVLAYLARQDHRRPAGFAVRRSDLLDGEVRLNRGMWLTSPARTAYDLGRFAANLRSATGFVDAALWHAAVHPVTKDDLRDMVAAHPHGKGNPQLRAAVDLANGRARSFTESSLRVRWVRELDVPQAGLLTNATIEVGGRSIELDLVDLTSGLVIEYDGAHHADSQQRSRDAGKDAALADLGLVVVRCNSPELRASLTAFGHWAGRRRESAIAQGSRERVHRLVADGVLAERPLKLF